MARADVACLPSSAVPLPCCPPGHADDLRSHGKRDERQLPARPANVDFRGAVCDSRLCRPFHSSYGSSPLWRRPVGNAVVMSDSQRAWAPHWRMISARSCLASGEPLAEPTKE